MNRVQAPRNSAVSALVLVPCLAFTGAGVARADSDPSTTPPIPLRADYVEDPLAPHRTYGMTARIGFAVSCDGGPCAAPLSCHRYANEPGVCTHACASAGECESTLPAASCGTDAGMCQWSCTDGGVCPVGLTCVIADGGKFCSGI